MGITNWIMRCVVSTNFVDLVNCGASNFFKASRGIRQGFPLSPFLFLLITEALSLQTSQARFENKIKEVKVSSHFHITHLLFVEDVSLFGIRDIDEWSNFK